MAILLGPTANQQIGRVVRDHERTYANRPPDQNLPPVIDPTTIIRCGILQADLIGQTTTAVFANEQHFARNTSQSGSLGTWANVVDANNMPVQLRVVDYLLPSNKKIQSGKKVVCVHVAPDVCIVIACECPVSV